VLLDEERLLVRVLAAAVVIEGRATGQCQRGGGDGEQTFHVHSWIGFAFSLTLPSTTSTRKPTALTWYRSRTRSLCLLIMAVSCSKVMDGGRPSFTCSFSISLYNLRISSPFELDVTFTTYASASADVTGIPGRGGAGGGGAIAGISSLSAALRRRKSSGPSS